MIPKPFWCPRCIKRAYWLRGDADAAAEASNGKLRVYAGECGYWHLATDKKVLRKIRAKQGR